MSHLSQIDIEKNLPALPQKTEKPDLRPAALREQNFLFLMRRRRHTPFLHTRHTAFFASPTSSRYPNPKNPPVTSTGDTVGTGLYTLQTQKVLTTVSGIDVLPVSDNCNAKSMSYGHAQTIPVSEAKPAAKPIKFVHEKSPQFRTYHADGGWCVMNSALKNVNLNFYAEFPKVADSVVHPVNPDGTFANGVITGAGESDPTYYLVTRDFQCSVVLTRAAAILVREQLTLFIDATAEKSEKNQT